jgi:hypothetical protein
MLPLASKGAGVTYWVTTGPALPRPAWTVVDALAHFFPHLAAHRFDLIRQRSLASLNQTHRPSDSMGAQASDRPPRARLLTHC